MARANVQMSPEKVTGAVAVTGNFEHLGRGRNGGGEVAERQARAIMSTAKRALEEEAAAAGGSGGKLSMKRSMEWFLESRRKRSTVAAAAAGAAAGEYGPSSSCSN
uniref:Uncharacterized protein n=1 Tax=Leersia perrieri TaxID=77586 RepID=A0A0D9WT96_9ORYZ